MINCIIVDDEPLAREILETFTRKVPFLNLAASCKNAFEAINELQKGNIDLVFLDIQMPDLNGIQLYKSLTYKPLLIFTTAYSNFAVDGFEMDAIDYLVKPFSFERFIKAANKALEVSKAQFIADRNSRDFMFVKDGTKVVKINFTDILYLEGMKDYVKIVLKDKFVLTLITMQNIMNRLPSDRFTRIHRSYIVNISQIDLLERNRIVIKGKWLPIGSSYKEHLAKVLGKIN